MEKIRECIKRLRENEDMPQDIWYEDILIVSPDKSKAVVMFDEAFVYRCRIYLLSKNVGENEECWTYEANKSLFDNDDVIASIGEVDSIYKDFAKEWLETI